MPLRKSDEFLMQQQILLGGKVSQKHQEFKEIAKLSPDYADIYMICKQMPEWEKEKDEDKVLLETIELFGEIDFVRTCAEITRLAMILGDTREAFNAKGVIDELRQARSNTSA